MIAFIICFIIAGFAKWYVSRNCKDNPEIIWIWLDEDDEPQGGCRVKTDEPARVMTPALCPVPCA